MGLALSSLAGQIHVLGGTSFPSTTTTTTLRKLTSRSVFLGQRLYSNGLISLSKNSSRRETNHDLVRAVNEKVVGIDSELLGADLRAVNEKVAGIDLGTTNSAVAALGEDGKPTNIEGKRTTPPVVAKTPSLLNIRSKKRTRRKLGLKGINIPTKRVPSGGENAKSGRRRRRSQSLGKREAVMAGAINLQEKDDDSKTVKRKSEVAGVVRPTTPLQIAEGNLPVSNSTQPASGDILKILAAGSAI